MPPSGAVSSTAEAATSSVSGQRRERLAGGREMSGPVAEVAAERHVRALAPAVDHVRSPTAKCRAMRWRSAATSPSSRIARSSSACPPAASAARRASASVSLGVRAELAATCSICAGEPIDRAELRRAAVAAIASACRAGLAGGADDRVERLAASALSSSTPATASPPALHLPAHGRHLRRSPRGAWRASPRRLQALGREVAHLVGHHREPSPLARPRAPPRSPH